MNKLKQFITARRISLGLILLLAGLMYLSTVIPQHIDTPQAKIEAWRMGHSGLTWLLDSLGLHSMYAQPWFAAIILFAALSLGASSWDQLNMLRKKLTSFSTASADEISAEATEHQLCSTARSHGYRFIQTGAGGQLKFIKYPWGFFGSLLLHIGITLVVSVSFYIALTARQGVLILVEGEQRTAGQAWDMSEQGLMASPLKLPGAVRLDRVKVQFDDKQQPLEVFSDITITDDSGRSEPLTTSINRIQSYHGMRIYHASQYGNAFVVEVTDASGAVHSETIAPQQPVSISDPGYSYDFGVSWTRYMLSAKYYADLDRKSMLSTNPELVLRLSEGEREIARSSLTQGASGRLGEFGVHLNDVKRWSKLIFVDITGMPAIFTGFAVIMLGGLLQYLCPPRELIGIRRDDGRYEVCWKAASFREFFLEERDEVSAELHKESGP